MNGSSFKGYKACRFAFESMRRITARRALALLSVAIISVATFVASSAKWHRGGFSAQAQTFSLPRRVPVYGYQIIHTYPHDPAAFTQGLVYLNGFLYESTGIQGQSTFRKVNLTTGQVLQSKPMDEQYFGEGLAILAGKAYQLTWLDQQGFVYDVQSFGDLSTFTYTGQGWGLTTDGHSLIMSNGSNRLTFLNPNTMTVERTIDVFESGKALTMLNELEYINGEIFANVWMTDRIVRIDPETGVLKSWIDMSGLLTPAERLSADNVLNGIAFDSATGRIFVTGKRWPKLFEIKITQSKRPSR